MKTPEQKSADALKARLWLYFRITPEEQIKIEKWQRENGLAIVMGASEESTGTDHDHTTGLIRGRMDFRLNRALGLIEAFAKKLEPKEWASAQHSLNSTAAVLRAMAFYIEVLPAQRAVGNKYGLIGKAKRKKKMVYGPPKEGKQ